MPPREPCDGVAAQFPQSIYTVLKDVGWSPLVAFREGSQNCILFLPQPRVAKLHIVLLLQLAEAAIHAVLFVLTSQIGEHSTFGVERVRFRVEVVFKFKQQIEGQAGKAGLNLVIQDKVGIVVTRVEMKDAFGIHKGGVRHPVRGKDAWGKCRRIQSAGASLSFARDWNACDGCGAAARQVASSRGSNTERAAGKDGVGAVPLQAQE